MELTATQKDFLSENHNAVCTTFRRNGAAQLSIVTSGLYGGGAPLSRRRPIAPSTATWAATRAAHCWCRTPTGGRSWCWRATRRCSPRTTRPPRSCAWPFRDVFRAASGKEHPNWDEYDRVMVEDRRVIVIVTPEHVYGTVG